MMTRKRKNTNSPTGSCPMKVHVCLTMGPCLATKSLNDGVFGTILRR